MLSILLGFGGFVFAADSDEDAWSPYRRAENVTEQALGQNVRRLTTDDIKKLVEQKQRATADTVVATLAAQHSAILEEQRLAFTQTTGEERERNKKRELSLEQHLNDAEEQRVRDLRAADEQRLSELKAAEARWEKDLAEYATAFCITHAQARALLKETTQLYRENHDFKAQFGVEGVEPQDYIAQMKRSMRFVALGTKELHAAFPELKKMANKQVTDMYPK